MSETGDIDHLTLITAGTMSGLSYDEHGHITNAEALSFADLPPATNITIGAVKIPTTNSNPLTVDGDGDCPAVTRLALRQERTYQSVDQYGHVTAGDAA